MNQAQAAAEIEAIFDTYKVLKPADPSWLPVDTGKLYELYVLSQLLDELAGRGCRLVFRGTHLAFKAAPGQIKPSDPHFEVYPPHGPRLWLFVDIEFRTLGSTEHPVHDYSGYHELDIVLVTDLVPNPLPYQIAFAVECKCVAKFSKRLIKEALGVRRELAYFHRPQPSGLSQRGAGAIRVNADPPSEFWLAHIDAAGSNYAQSPAVFGIELRHIQP